jgi:hypothetical protein
MMENKRKIGLPRRGMSTMKQDHTDSQLLQTPRCLSDPGFADSALAAQLNALEDHNCTLMGGGYTAKGWLHGSRHKALTHARLGADYFGWCEPTNRSEYPQQWHPHCSHGKQKSTLLLFRTRRLRLQFGVNTMDSLRTATGKLKQKMYSSGNYWSWKVSEASLGSWALGMQPYKGTILANLVVVPMHNSCS